MYKWFPVLGAEHDVQVVLPVIVPWFVYVDKRGGGAIVGVYRLSNLDIFWLQTAWGILITKIFLVDRRAFDYPPQARVSDGSGYRPGA